MDLTCYEVRTRKWWLISLFTDFFISKVLSIIFFPIFLTSAKAATTLLLSLGINFFFHPWLTYYCAYRKHGTCYLTFLLIISSASLLFSLLFPVSHFYAFLKVCSFIWWFIL